MTEIKASSIAVTYQVLLLLLRTEVTPPPLVFVPPLFFFFFRGSRVVVEAVLNFSRKENTPIYGVTTLEDE